MKTNINFNKHVMERVDAIEASFGERKYRESDFTGHEITIEVPKVTDKETYTDTAVKVRVTAKAFDHTTIAAIANVVCEKPVWMPEENKEFYSAGFISADDGGGVVAIIVFTEMVFKTEKGGAQ